MDFKCPCVHVCHNYIVLMVSMLLFFHCRECFLPMTELSGNVKQVCTYLNQIFPGGALFLVATETELKCLFLEMSNTLLEDDEFQRIFAARMVGINVAPGSRCLWLFSPDVTIDDRGNQLERG